MKTKTGSRQRKWKKMLKILFIIIILLIIAVICYFSFMTVQLRKLSKMTVKGMIRYVTEDQNTYVSMAIINNGEITYHTYGKSGTELENTDYDYEIGSISKTMAALLVSRAIAEGRLKLSDSVSEYLDLPKNKYYPTIERLMTHTSGYKGYYWENVMIGNHLNGRNDFYSIDKESLLKKVTSINLKDKDYKFTYSNFGISVIGLVLEFIYQKDYTQLLSDYLHNDLNLHNTRVATCDGNLGKCWDWKQGDAYIPAGAVISDIKDMAAYLNFYMTSDEPYVYSALEPVKNVTAGNIFYDNMDIKLDAIGLTWIHDKENHLIWHNGGTSNYNSYIAMNEDRTKGIVILSNYGPDKKFPVTVIGAKMMIELEAEQ